MNKKIKIMLFLIFNMFLLAAYIGNSDKTGENVKTKNNGVKNKSFIDEIDKKHNLYSYGLQGYTLLFGYDYLYEAYLISFLNEEEYYEANEERVTSYKNLLTVFDERFGAVYNGLKDDIVPLIRKEINKVTIGNSRIIDKKYEKFLELTEEKLKIMEKIKKYYRSGEYKKDNFSRGIKLHKEYIENYIKTNDKYKEVYKLFIEDEESLLNDYIEILKNEKATARMELTKARQLLKIFTKELYASAFHFEFSKIGTIIGIDEKNYFSNLEDIQKRLEDTISSMEKIDRNVVEKEKLNFKKYLEIIEIMKTASESAGNIIDKFKRSDYEDLMQVITEFTQESYISERKIEELETK